MNGSRTGMGSARARTLWLGIGAALLVALVAALLIALPRAGAGDADLPPGDWLAPVPFEPPPGGTGLPEVLSVRGAKRGSEGWFLLDATARRVHLLAPSGEVERSFGRRGEGPGEFRFPEELVLIQDTVVIMDTDGGFPVLKYFLPDGHFLRQHRLAPEHCASFIPMHLATGPDGLLVVAGQCAGLRAVGMQTRLLGFHPEGEPHTLHRGKRVQPMRINPFQVPVATVREGEVWVGYSSAPCFLRFPLQAGGEDEARRVCPERWDRVSLSEEKREEFLESLGDVGALERLFHLPDHLPTYDAVFPHEHGLVLRALSGEDSRRLLFMDPGGRVRVLVEGLSEFTFVDSGEVLTAWQEPEGTRIWTFSLPRDPMAKGPP